MDQFRPAEERSKERLGKYFEGLADGALWGAVYGCVIGVSIVVPACHFYGVGEEQNKEIYQERLVKSENKAGCILPKNTP